MSKIESVLASIPNEQYAQGYEDPHGKKGFRNPVRADVGQGLTDMIRVLQIKRGVELGTALGRSGLHMALGGLETLDTVEFDPEAAATAQANFDEAGVGFKVHNADSGEFTRGYQGDGVEVLFIDHAKERYLEDLKAMEPHLTADALVLLDNSFNRAAECKDAVAYVAANYLSVIFTEPPTDGETTGLMIASKDRTVFDQAVKAVIDARVA